MQAQLPLWQLRAEFAVRLAALYGAEVPAYNTLVEVSKEVNSDFVKANGADAERLGSIERVTAERHGAIRVGSPTELAQVARIFAGFGMHAVGFYDLRDASKSSVPVVSTAFRPIEADELARNPFRVFTSMLVSNDPRFFDEATQDRLEAFISQRQLFSPRLLELADLSTTQHGLAPMHATEFLDLATAAFKLSDTPSTGSGTDTWRASRPSLPTSAGSRQPTSTTSHPACWTSTSSIAAWRHAASS
jgi:uncharacterized glyoxalase superfamily metalloenzyme YdcJ